MSGTAAAATAAAVARPRAKGAPEPASAAKKAARKQPAAKANAEKPNAAAREGSKKAIVLDMLRRAAGVDSHGLWCCSGQSRSSDS